MTDTLEFIKTSDFNATIENKHIKGTIQSIEETTNYQLSENIKPLLNNGSTYFDILIYNCYDSNNNTIDITKLSTAIDDILGTYEKLFDFALSLSGYQFIGLNLQNGLSSFLSLKTIIAGYILAFGFLASMFGALLCFLVLEYLRGCRDETPEFIIIGIQKYKNIFKQADRIIYANCILFIIPINIMIFDNLGNWYGLPYSIISLAVFVIGIYYHTKIIVFKQKYQYKNINYYRKIYLN